MGRDPSFGSWFKSWICRKTRPDSVDGKQEVSLSMEGETEKCARKEGKNRSVHRRAPPQAQSLTGSAAAGAGDRQETVPGGLGGGCPGPPTSSCK